MVAMKVREMQQSSATRAPEDTHPKFDLHSEGGRSQREQLICGLLSAREHGLDSRISGR